MVLNAPYRLYSPHYEIYFKERDSLKSRMRVALLLERKRRLEEAKTKNSIKIQKERFSPRFCTICDEDRLINVRNLLSYGTFDVSYKYIHIWQISKRANERTLFAVNLHNSGQHESSSSVKKPKFLTQKTGKPYKVL